MDEKKTPKDDFNRLAIGIFLRLSGWIAIPVIAALFAGNWLDEKFKTEPTFTFISIGIAFITTVVGLARKGKKLMKEMDSDDKSKCQNPNVKSNLNLKNSKHQAPNSK